MYHGICLILGGVKYANKNMCKIWKKDQDSGGSATQSKPVIFPKNTCTLWTCRCEVKSQKALWKSIDDIPWVWPPHVTVTTKIITFLAGDPYKPSFTTVIVRGPHPRYTRLLFNNQNCTKMTWHIGNPTYTRSIFGCQYTRSAYKKVSHWCSRWKCSLWKFLHSHAGMWRYAGMNTRKLLSTNAGFALPSLVSSWLL